MGGKYVSVGRAKEPPRTEGRGPEVEYEQNRRKGKRGVINNIQSIRSINSTKELRTTQVFVKDLDKRRSIFVTCIYSFLERPLRGFLYLASQIT